ncbi:MAG TPA: DCC1-like thiol-disulfide oxidoreductase family protein [Allosphingosinicella sp.]|nr:DCC1-like thiol-disulfide oxidoreductase family protein [Allosphingosinicella sp.]
MAGGGPIILFDGHCVLCSANARFVLRHDRARRFRLAAAQSEAGQRLQARFGINREALETIAVIEGERVRTESDAVIAIAAGLGWPWRAAAAARLVPRALRDPLYRWIARNRYRWFGRREACWRPDPADADRML